MDRYSKVEPHPRAFNDLLQLQGEDALTYFSMVHLRRDRPDGMADKDFKSWCRLVVEMGKSAEANSVEIFKISHSSKGDHSHWDYCLVVHFPCKRAAAKFFLDERQFDNIEVRRAAMGEAPALLMSPWPVAPRRQLASLWGPPIVDIEKVPQLMDAVYGIERLPETQGFTQITIGRLVRSEDHEIVAQAYEGWRAAIESIAPEYGIQVGLCHSIVVTFVGEAREWDIVTSFDFPSPKIFRQLLDDPRIREAGPMRSASLEVSAHYIGHRLNILAEVGRLLSPILGWVCMFLACPV